MALTKQERRIRIKRRSRKQMKGTAAKPRMSVFRSNKQIYVQFIDDLEGKTLLSVCSRTKDLAEKGTVAKLEQAKLVGQLASKKALEQGITEVVFDRNGCLYHGRVKSLAEAAREGGLKF